METANGPLAPAGASAAKRNARFAGDSPTYAAARHPDELFRRRKRKGRATPPAARVGLLLLCAAAIAVATGHGGLAQAAPTLKTLYSFKNVRGAESLSNLVADGAGNFYGTTFAGGSSNDGVVFELSPPAAGKRHWSETVLLTFRGSNGQNPFAGLIADAAGNLYGTTGTGGENNDGVVFELSPPGGGQKHWKETVLLSFNGANGSNPYAGLIADSAGNLYGTTYAGGSSDAGTVFELRPPASGQTAWTETVLFSFDGPGASNPFVGVVADGAGNLYGTTTYGGRDKQGVAFELSPPAAGQSAWTETVLFSFHTTAGEPSQGSLILDRAGNLYGTTTYGGADREGVVFELIPPGDGGSRWTEAVLQSFTGTNGEHLYGALIADGAGNLYGTAYDGGANDDGVVFELSPPLAGQTAWTETVLQSFDGADGKGPDAGLIADGAGDLYGTTRYGGSRGAGVVFKLTP